MPLSYPVGRSIIYEDKVNVNISISILGIICRYIYTIPTYNTLILSTELRPRQTSKQRLQYSTNYV